MFKPFATILLSWATASLVADCALPELYSSGSLDIDQTRREVASSSTDATNYQQRALVLFLWIGALQQQGADTRPFFDIDQRYYELESRASALSGNPSQSMQEELYRTIDRGYGVVEGIQKVLVERGPIAEPFEGPPDAVANGGDMTAEWPMFQANKHNTGFTTAPGPRCGRAAWKFPVGLGWYCRPLVEGDRVYFASPGLRSIMYCVDLESGDEIWKATQEHPLFGIYKYPAIASTPIVVQNQLVVREINSHGGNQGQAKHLVYIDKENGSVVSRTYSGHVDYRTRYAPVASNGEYVVYPFGIHDIYGSPAICQPFNHLICANGANDRKLWEFNVGEIDALAEPVVTRNHVFQGTMEGYVYSLELQAKSSEERIAWKFRANGSVNSAVEVVGDRVYFGCNDGFVYCLDELTGKPRWQTRIHTVERNARKHFTTPTIDGDRIYIGAANRRLYCLREHDGSTIWDFEVADWVRSRPVVLADDILVATVDGKVYSINKEGERNWQRSVSSHPIYADLITAREKVLVTDSNLYVYCLSKDGEELWRKSLLSSFKNAAGERIFTDQLSGGTYYQSKPTAYRGKILFGTPAGFLHAVDAQSGAEVWKFEMGGAISVGPACVDGKVYAGQQGGERFFYCLDAEDGSLIWKQTVPGGWVWGSAAVDEGLVYVPTVDGYAVCLDGDSGRIVWMYPTAMSVPAEPAIEAELVYFGSWSRSLYAFNKKTGDIVWKENGIGLDSGTLIAYRGKVYVPHLDSIFMSFDAKTGELLSKGNRSRSEKGQYTNFNASPAFHDGRGFFSARVGTGLRGVPLSSKVYSVDVETGEIHWIFPDGGGLSAPAIANGRVYIGSGTTPFFYCLDEETGRPHWIYKLGHRLEEATLCIYRDRVYALAADGYLHAIE
jgi:outer membrane protein assembly factor BamB